MKISGEKQLDLLTGLVNFVFSIQRHLTFIKEVNNPELKPCIYALWHGHQCCVFGVEDKSHLNVLISRSIDGEIIARAVERLGFKTVRGSKGKKGSVEATMQLLDRLKNSECIAMTVDGPSGPAFKVKEGVIKIAKMSGAPIIPVYWYSPQINFIKFPSWDKLLYPLGATWLVNLYGEPIYVNSDNTDQQDEQIRMHLENVLKELEEKAPQAHKEAYKFRLWKKN